MGYQGFSRFVLKINFKEAKIKRSLENGLLDVKDFSEVKGGSMITRGRRGGRPGCCDRSFYHFQVCCNSIRLI
jgi:hypothetical protein